MDSEQFSLIFSVACAVISVTSAIVAAVYGFEAHKDLQEYKKAEVEKKRAEEYRKFFAELTRK